MVKKIQNLVNVVCERPLDRILLTIGRILWRIYCSSFYLGKQFYAKSESDFMIPVQLITRKRMNYKQTFFKLMYKPMIHTLGPSLNTQSCNKGILGVQGICFGPFGQPGHYWKKKFGPIMGNFWGQFFYVFMNKKFFFLNIVASALKSCTITLFLNFF